MKHIIVAGAPRSGKTTISRELTYLGYVHYRLDSIKRAVFSIFCPGVHDWHKASKVTVEIIEKLVDDNDQESSRMEYFIFDTPHVYPEDVRHLDKNKYLIVFLGYTDVSLEDKVNHILAHDTKTCWTQKLPREKLTSLVEGNIAFSKEISAQCVEYGIPYFDVSHDIALVLSRVKRYIELNS